MAQRSERIFRIVYLFICSAVFAVVALRAWHIPFVHDEITTFFFYVQNGDFLPYRSHVYTNNHILNSFLTILCYKVGGSHPFVLRIPNMMAFIALAVGVYRFFRYAANLPSRLVLIALFVLTFNFLDFFELCRGYGISLGAMVLGLSYLQDYFSGNRFRSLLWFSFWWQLALAANLTLILPFSLLLTLLIIFQASGRRLFTLANLALLAVNLFFLGFWIKFALFYREQRMLDSGAPENYWNTSFVSLIRLIFGTGHPAMQVAVVLASLLVAALAFRQFFRARRNIQEVFEPQVFYTMVLVLLVLAFFLQRKLLGINYPEDRTALSFYCFFVPALALSLECLPARPARILSGAIVAGSLLSFVMGFNLTTFSSLAYAVMPRAFAGYMASEQEQASAPLTLGGHRTVELNFAFANYRKGSPVNPMVVSEEMQMNTDYYYASLKERPYYRFFYDEVLYDEWDGALLKRRYPVTRAYLPAPEVKALEFSDAREYYDFAQFGDSLVPAGNSVEADMEIEFRSLPSPFRAFIVLQVNDTANQVLQYKRIDLAHLGDDLSGQKRRFRMACEPLPADYGKIAVYLWNIEGKPASFKLDRIRFALLKGKGVNTSIPPAYYRMVP